VDFPAPLGPKTTQRSPWDIEKLRGPKIVRSPRRTETSVRVKTELLIDAKDTGWIVQRVANLT
jgi:hypothetical protein